MFYGNWDMVLQLKPKSLFYVFYRTVFIYFFTVYANGI